MSNTHIAKINKEKRVFNRICDKNAFIVNIKLISGHKRTEK